MCHYRTIIYWQEIPMFTAAVSDDLQSRAKYLYYLDWGWQRRRSNIAKWSLAPAIWKLTFYHWCLCGILIFFRYFRGMYFPWFVRSIFLPTQRGTGIYRRAWNTGMSPCPCRGFSSSDGNPKSSGSSSYFVIFILFINHFPIVIKKKKTNTK